VKYHCIIASDSNCGDIDWQALAAPVDGIQDEHLNFSITNGFSQVVQSATRANNCLDIVFSHKPLAMYNMNVLHPFSTSDHCHVEFSVFSYSPTQSYTSPNMKHLDWNNANFNGISNYLAVLNWFDLLTTNLTAESVWSAFSEVLHTALDMFVPLKPVKNSNIKSQRWYPAALRHAINTKQRCSTRVQDLDSRVPFLGHGLGLETCGLGLATYGLGLDTSELETWTRHIQT